MKNATQILESKNWDGEKAQEKVIELDAIVRDLYNVHNHPIYLLESYSIGDAEPLALLLDAESNSHTPQKYDDVNILFKDMSRNLLMYAEFEPILVEEEDLHDVLKNALKIALDFEWQSGWRIPIYVNEKGKVSAGEWLSQGSIQPDIRELAAVYPWLLSDFIETDDLSEEALENEADWQACKLANEYVRQVIDEIKLESEPTVSIN